MYSHRAKPQLNAWVGGQAESKVEGIVGKSSLSLSIHQPAELPELRAPVTPVDYGP